MKFSYIYISNNVRLLFSLVLLITLIITLLPINAAISQPLCMDCSQVINLTVKTCKGEGELYLYKGDPFQTINTSFIVERDQVLIFTRSSPFLSVKVNGIDAVLNLVKELSYLNVKVYSFNTSIGSIVSIEGEHPDGARSVQGYLAQNSSQPIYDINTLHSIWNDKWSGVFLLSPGNYSYPLFDKYSKNQAGHTDNRELNVKIEGPIGVILDQTYIQPSPSEGAVITNFEVEPGNEGVHTVTIDTEDSIYWLFTNCNETAFFYRLNLEKKAYPEIVNPGDNFYYYLNLTNTGTKYCKGIGLKEYYDSNTSFITSNPMPSVGNDTWNFSTLFPGETKEVNITMQVSPDAICNSTLINLACFHFEGTWNCVKKEALVNCSHLENESYCNLKLEKTDNPDPVKPGNYLNYSLKLTNTGNDTCINVEVREYYDPNTSFITSNPMPSTGNDTWNFSEIISGETKEINITVNTSSDVNCNFLLLNKACFLSKGTNWNCIEEETDIECPVYPISPTAMILTPLDGSKFREGSSIYFSGTGFDPDGNITAYLWTSSIDGIINTASSFTTNQLTVGEHAITFTVFDNENQTDSDIINITVKDMNAPIAYILSPMNGNKYREGSNISFIGIGYDPNGNIINYSWSSNIDGSIGKTPRFNLNNLSIGTHIITFMVTDTDNLTDSDSVRILIKSLQEPIVSILNPDDGDHFKQGDSIFFEGEGYDSDGQIVSWIWESSLDNIFGNEKSFTYSNLSLGRHKITLNGTDDMNYMDSSSINIFIDPVKSPNITINSPRPGAYKENESILFNATIIDDGSIMNYVWSSSQDGKLMSGTGMHVPFILSNLTIGVHYITLTATDNDSLTSSSSVRIVIIPISAPYVEIVSPIDNSSITYGENTEFKSIIIDDGNITHIVWNSNLEGDIANIENFSYLLIPGKHKISLFAIDDEGLIGMDFITVIVKPDDGDNGNGDGGTSGGGGNFFWVPVFEKCGNRYCAPSENCSTCPEDCGECPGPCIESWICSEWSDCMPSGINKRVCVDHNNCGTDINKPKEFKFCEYKIQEKSEENETYNGVKKAEGPKITGLILEMSPWLLGLIIFIIIIILMLLSLLYKRRRRKEEE